MSNNNDEQIDLACRGFHKAVQAYCRRYTVEDKVPRDVEELVNHSQQFLQQLISKRKSLQNGLSHLQRGLWPQVLERFQKNPAERASLLQHFLEQCLRLHDGMLLLVSGECRHKGDIRLAKRQTKFKSKLPLQNERGDGYTKLFNAPGGYSGYGWDEFHDDQMGIKVRLLQALQRYSSKKRRSKEKIWDSLMGQGGQAFEAVLDQHESTMINVKFTSLKDQVVRDLKLYSAKSGAKNIKVSFVLHDKLEKLQYGDISLERQGDQFQVGDPRGALPNGFTVQDWEGIMILPTLTKNNDPKKPSSQSAGKNKPEKAVGKEKGAKKRRRIIEDSSDEEEARPIADNDKTKKTRQTQVASKTMTATPNKISGLNVKIKKETKPPTPGDAASSSLAVIKAKFGVEGEALEASREVVEREEANASKAAKVEEEEAMATTIRQGQANIKSQRRVLTRALTREDRDVKECWDARELLREQHMALGNQILWEPSESSSQEEQKNNDRKRMLLAAYENFQQAKAVVDEQEGFRRYLNSQGKYTPAEARFFARNLLLLFGQAFTNMGITNLQLADVSKRKIQYRTADSKRYLRNAVEDLSKAKEYAVSLRLRSNRDREKGSNAMETKVDAVSADQLESLALRWWGQALWRQGLRKEASAKFASAGSIFSASCGSFTADDLRDDGLHGALRQLGVECYYAHAALADLAFAEMESLPLTGAVQEGNELFSHAKTGLKKASDVSEAISKCFGSTLDSDDYADENEILDREAIQKWMKEYEDWWDRRKDIANKPLAVDSIPTQRNPVRLPRSEVEPHGLQGMPTRRFVVHESVSRRKKKSNGPNPMYHQHSGELLSALPQYSDSQEDSFFPEENEPKKYRPWGDELLPKLAYPSVAPEMPEHIRAQLQ